MATSNGNNNPVAVALLGAGYISDYHLNALRQLPNVDVRAICDLNRGLAERFAAAKGVPNVYSDLGEMLSTEKLDVVHVLTPPHVHFVTGSQILEAGVDAFIEKPLCHTVDYCQKLRQLASDQGRSLGVSHNFLYFPAYEKLLTDLRSGRLGRLDQIDIVWNKELGQLKGGPFGAWMLASPKNILFEVAPHSFVHLVHLIGSPDSLSVDVHDKVELPRGLEFYRRWEIRGWKDNTSIRIRFSFIDGYPEHYIHIRGTNGVARVDFENNTYVCNEHTPYLLDVDRYANVVGSARDSVLQASGTLSNFVLSKMRLSKAEGPFPYSIARTVESFYNGRGSVLDERVEASIGEAAVAVAEWVAREANLPEPQKTASAPVEAVEPPVQKPTVLVIGGTGFIGRALVRRLRADGRGVRVLSRNPRDCPPELLKLQVDIAKGDFTDPEALEAALEGIRYVYHLGRGYGKTWEEYLKYDVEPTRKLGELCIKHGVERLFYASSIAIYYAGENASTITEETKPHEGVMRSSPYPRSKVENERVLLELHREQRLPVVIFRPGIVLGAGGSPYHWGVAAWPYNSVAALYGSGNNRLPIVLVDDVADAMARAIDLPNIDGESFNLCSAPCITANEYLDELENRAGIKLRRVPTPGWRAYTEAVAKWAIKSVGRDPNVALPSYAECEGRSCAARFDASKAERRLGWSPVKDRETIIYKGIYLPVDEFFA
ncbi:NAD-dependent epimerase/dehydratase family protein [Microcoleus sp. FACHB-68]|uniref:NAD-dependent epimerase/dehydratase family protein n=1 Tax=Microcoleus sp. FACHB-68 TaxID=2692826 RepID=UPI0016841552|nr:NAD-dependent epimerase/dehydratase family protein [Microcoleus sp. FACHB-68]MBD1939487.1 NAD-dependent epimerase/dehydratase family protein [Microcoleus sp. FACHB-68]